MSKVAFIKEAGHGMGVEFAKAGLAAGYRGVAKMCEEQMRVVDQTV